METFRSFLFLWKNKKLFLWGQRFEKLFHLSADGVLQKAFWKRETFNFFFGLHSLAEAKESKKVAKRSRWACCSTCFAVHQVCRTLVIGFRGYRQNGNFSNTRSQQLLKSRFTKELCKFDGRVLIHLHHANHGIPNRVGSDIPRFVGIVAILDASGASTKLWIFPPSYLAPNRLWWKWTAAISSRSVGIK